MDERPRACLGSTLASAHRASIAAEGSIAQAITFIWTGDGPDSPRSVLVSGGLVTRRSLRPQLNQIRAWVRQGRTDAWIAHQLEVTVQQIQAFKREQDLAPVEEGEGAASPADYDDEIDLRAEDDALIAAELDAAAAREAQEEAEAKERAEAEAQARAEAEPADDDEAPARRTRRRRGGRGRGRRAGSGGPLEATFDHGEEGYGLWLDPAVQDDPVYAEYWAGHRPVEVTIEEDQIVIRRAGGDDPDADEDE
jgi:hypothetical protein